MSSRISLKHPTNEASVKRAIINYLLYRGALVIVINSGAVQPKDNGGSRYIAFNRWQVLGLDSQTAGVADILALIPPSEGYILEKQFGRLLVVECKAPGRRHNTTEAQRQFMAEAEARGAVVCVATCIEDVERALEGVGG
jgi:hypothetical protein